MSRAWVILSLSLYLYNLYILSISCELRGFTQFYLVCVVIMRHICGDLGSAIAQYGLKVTTLHQLHNHQIGLLLRANTKEPHDFVWTINSSLSI